MLEMKEKVAAVFEHAGARWRAASDGRTLLVGLAAEGDEGLGSPPASFVDTARATLAVAPRWTIEAEPLRDWCLSVSTDPDDLMPDARPLGPGWGPMVTLRIAGVIVDAKRVGAALVALGAGTTHPDLGVGVAPAPVGPPAVVLLVGEGRAMIAPVGHVTGGTLVAPAWPGFEGAVVHDVRAPR